MNWISNVVPPKIRSMLKRDTPENLWTKCPESGELVFNKDLEANLWVVPGSGFHMRMPAEARLKSLFDDGAYDRLPTPDVPLDPLKFRDVKRYTDRLKENRAKTGQQDAVRLAAGKLEGQNIYEFRYKGDPTKRKHVGVIAQEVEKARPDVVRKDSKGVRSVNYGKLFKAGVA